MKKAIIIILILVAFILLFPFRSQAKDGGSVRYQAALYTVYKVHSLYGGPDTKMHYVEGIIIEILGHQVYNNTNPHIENFGDNPDLEKKYVLPWDRFCYSAVDGSVIELEPAQKKFIIDLLSNGDWYDDLAKCPSDVKFYTQNQEIGYCAEEGIFNDFTSGKSLKISEENRVIVNEYLGLK